MSILFVEHYLDDETLSIGNKVAKNIQEEFEVQEAKLSSYQIQKRLRIF